MGLGENPETGEVGYRGFDRSEHDRPRSRTCSESVAHRADPPSPHGADRRVRPGTQADLVGVMKARQSNWPGDPSRRSSRTTRSPVPPAVLLLRRILRWNAPDAEGLRGRINTVIRAYLRWNRHLRLDPWMRYRPVVSAIATVVPDQDARVLDVGSGSVGLAHFLGRSVVGVDVEFTDRDWEQVPSRLVPVRGSATHLPFRDESFDAVVSMDTLEHIPRAGRPQAVAELFRVGRRLVVLGFPFGEASSRFDGAALLEERAREVPAPRPGTASRNCRCGAEAASRDGPFLVPSGGPQGPETPVEASVVNPKGVSTLRAVVLSALLADRAG